MRVHEFKAWLEGFSHSIDGNPTVEQWAIITGKIEKIEESGLNLGPTTWPNVVIPPPYLGPSSAGQDFRFPNVTCVN